MDPLSDDLLAPHTGAKRLPRKRKLADVNTLQESPYLQFDPIVEAAEVARLDKLRRMYVGGGCLLDDTFFGDVGAWGRLRDILGGLHYRPANADVREEPFYRMVSIAKLPAYRALTIEMCSTFTYRPLQEVRFRMGNIWHTWSMAQWAEMTGFYTADQLQQDVYTRSITRVDRAPLVAFWDYLTDHRDHFGKHSSPVSALRDPMHRILHHIIARTIVPRELTREKVNLGDLFHLYCLLTGRRANLADSLAQFFAGAHHRKEAGALYGGSFVTYIARRVLLEPQSDEGLEVIAPDPFGRPNVMAMGIVGKFDPPRLVSRSGDLVPFEPEDIPAEIPDYRESEEGVPDPDHQPQPVHPLPGELPQGPPVQPPVQPPQQQQAPQAPQHPQHVYIGLTPGQRAFAEHTEARLEHLETRLDQVDTRFDDLETRLQQSEERREQIERRRRRDVQYQTTTSALILDALRHLGAPIPPVPLPPQDSDDEAGDANSAV